MNFLPVSLDISADDIYSSFKNYPACSIVEYLPYTNRCNYVTTTDECNEKVTFINYMDVLYCCLRPTNDTEKILYVAFLMSFCAIIYMTLGIMVDKIFVPALKVISNTIGMNEHLAGVTILAFGNGSPDLFSSFGNMDSDQKRSVLSDLFGAGVYVTCVVGGLICMERPFKLQPNNLLRDALFLLLSVIFIDYAMVTNNHVTIIESVLIVSIYFIYMVIVLIDHLIVKSFIKHIENRMKLRMFVKEDTLRMLEELRAEVFIEIKARSSDIRIDVEQTRKVSYNALVGVNNGLYSQLAESLVPFTKQDWQKSNPLMKLFLIIKGGITIILVLFIPVVDYELSRHGWSKLLNTLQILFLPSIILVLVYRLHATILGIPICFLPFLVSAPLAIYMFLTTRTDIAPSYHGIISLYPIFSSCVIIYACARQTVLIFNVLGIVTHLSNSFLGCTFQAWGNSIGDFVANIALAKGGYPKMGFAACFGGPFFNSLLSVGGAFFYKSIHSKHGFEHVTQGILGENCVIFLAINITAILMWATLTDFNARRSIAYFNFTLYFLFLLYACLGELEIIQTYAPEVFPDIFDYN